MKIEDMKPPRPKCPDCGHVEHKARCGTWTQKGSAFVGCECDQRVPA